MPFGKAWRFGLPLMLSLLGTGQINSQIGSDKAAACTKTPVIADGKAFAVLDTVFEGIRVDSSFRDLWYKARLVDQTATEEGINFGFMKDDASTGQGHKVLKAALTDAWRRSKEAVSLGLYKPNPDLKFITTVELTEETA